MPKVLPYHPVMIPRVKRSRVMLLNQNLTLIAIISYRYGYRERDPAVIYIYRFLFDRYPARDTLKISMKCNSRVIESKLFPELWFKK
jgi:hypothetical protein